jgi:hypothetical protein
MNSCRFKASTVGGKEILRFDIVAKHSHEGSGRFRLITADVLHALRDMAADHMHA